MEQPKKQQWESVSSEDIKEFEDYRRGTDDSDSVAEFQEGRRPIAEDEKTLNKLEQQKENLGLQLEEVLSNIQETEKAIRDIKNRIANN